MRTRLVRRTSRARLLVNIARGMLILVVGGTVVTLGLFAYFAAYLPSPDKVVRKEGFATQIYDRRGELLYDVYANQKRTPVKLEQIPLVVRQATVAIEDKSFYKHQGFDPLTPLRIGWNIVAKQRIVGGSTLTQQLVKTVLLSPERTLTRKLKEFILTIQIERKYAKDQILQMYLNEVPYGGTAWGIEAAAQAYFGKSVADVTLEEAVILAGLPQSPTRYSPYSGKLYIARAEEVLRRMREDGYISRDQELEAKNKLPQVQFPGQGGRILAPHFVFYVRQQLVDRYGEKVIEESGLQVTTSLDLQLQEAAQKAVTEEIDKVKYLKITNGAAVVLDPATGQILAMVGSRGWDDPDYDGKYNVATALRQPGSAIKPVVYLTGLKKGYTAATLLMDTKTSFPGGDKPEYVPENYDGKFRGPLLVRGALGNSINVPAVKMLSMVGVKDTLEVAYNLGISSLQPTPQTLSRVGLSVALGGGEVRLLELASAYSAFANGGKRVDPVAILKVTDKDGRVLEEWKPPANWRQAISAEEAFIISSILSDPKARDITFGPRSAINLADRTVAVKTGTTNDKKDNWTIGWTPRVVVGVWVGNNDNSSMKEVASGVTGAAPIWRRIILAALNKFPDETFAVPAGIVVMDVDKVSGYPAHDGYEAKTEYFIKGTEPQGEDPVHRKTKVCKGEARLATAADIAAGNYEEKEYFFFKEEDPFGKDGQNKWQEGILNWLKDQADSRFHPPTDFCTTANQVVLTVLEPADKTRVDTNDVHFRVDITAANPIKKLEISVDGVVQETLTAAPWEVIVHISNGSHRIDLRAEDDKGNVGSRFLLLGINQPWDALPSPSPSP